MIFDKVEHQKHILDCLNNVTVPGAHVEFHAEVKRAVREAQIAVPPPPVELPAEPAE